MSHVPYPRPCGDFRTTYAEDASLYKTRPAFRAAVAITLLAALMPIISWTMPAVVSTAMISNLIQIGILAIAALGLNVLVGFTGQISLGHAAFFGFGAFSSAYLVNNFSVPVLLAIPAAGIVTALVGFLFGLPAARLKGLYLAIATLAAQFILEDFFARATWFTEGYGVTADRPVLAGLSLADDRWFYYVVLFWVIISFIGVSNLRRSRDGRAFVAVRDHYLSAEIMGINLTKYRVLSFGVSSFFAGLAGALYGHFLGFVSVEAFTILLSIQFLAMIIIGGLGSVTGSLLGAAFIFMLPPTMQSFASSLAEIFPAMQQGVAYVKEMAIGLAIILFLILEPEGLIHLWRRIRASWKLFPFSH
ncbi:MAG: branched-chain amino acid ABC transporter permease [Neomegalonema sp.]|nr:branched-chain amino acid ABC transporter permease [Neomegalonema sp.]